MARTDLTASSIKIWRHSNLPIAPIPIDSTGPAAGGTPTGYLCKWLFIKAGVSNQDLVRVHPADGSNVFYYELASGEETPILYVDNTNFFTLSSPTADNEVYVLIGRQEGESQ